MNILNFDEKSGKEIDQATIDYLESLDGDRNFKYSIGSILESDEIRLIDYPLSEIGQIVFPDNGYDLREANLNTAEVNLEKVYVFSLWGGADYSIYKKIDDSKDAFFCIEMEGMSLVFKI